MHDQMDEYLSSCLKNWAARQPLPGHVRQDILNAAGGRVFLKKRSKVSWLQRIFFTTGALQSLLEDWKVTLPFTQTKTWSLHLATTLRVVT